MDHLRADAEVAPIERVAGFVDVLRTCEQWPLVGDAPAEDRFLEIRRRLPLPDGPISLEMAQVSPGDSGRGRFSADAFVLLLEGDMTFEQSGGACVLGGGEAGVVVREIPLDWRSDRGAKMVVMRCSAGGGAGASGPVRIDQGAPLAPSNPPAAEVLIGPTPDCRNHTDYRSVSGEFVCGTWDSTPYKRRLVAFRHYELMRLLEGSVTFVDASGREGTFRAGDIVLFEQGGGASWESREHVKKIYCTYRPA